MEKKINLATKNSSKLARLHIKWYNFIRNFRKSGPTIWKGFSPAFI